MTETRSVTGHEGPVVSESWLRAHLDDPRVKILDTRWYLSGKQGSVEYGKGHVAGAVFVDLESALASPKGQGPGRHPLPSRVIFERAMRAAGVSRDSFVVAYDDAGGSIAARLWWLLGHFGHGAAAVLDGGITKWDGPTQEGSGDPVAQGDWAAGDALPGFSAVDRAYVRDVSEGSRAGLLIDARAGERYRGETEPVDPRPGHIPGAVSAPWATSLEGGVFKSADTLKGALREKGVFEETEVVAYCGSGVTACHLLLSLARAGYAPEKRRLYEGSWSDWSSDTSLPAATGSEPRGG